MHRLHNHDVHPAPAIPSIAMKPLPSPHDLILQRGPLSFPARPIDGRETQAQAQPGFLAWVRTSVRRATLSPGVFIALGMLTLAPHVRAALSTSPFDWPAWRGPTRDGIATPGQSPPTRWSESENIVWKSELPGRGHSSPTVVGNRIYLATADTSTWAQSVLCLDRRTGAKLWTTTVHPSGGDPGKQVHSSAASSTITFDDGRLFVNFLNSGAVFTTALSPDGQVLWQRNIGPFVTHQGFASSPMTHEQLVLVASDHRGGGVVAGLHRDTGEVVWSHPRPKLPNYTSPSILRAAGKTQMVLAGCNLIASYNPLTGEKLWELPGSTEECVVSAVTDGSRIFVSGGYPKNHTVAVEADGSKRIAWQNTARVYVPSMIAQAGHLYAVMDAGLAVCWKSDSGEELWKERLGGDFFASPVMVNDLIYASNVSGKTFVFQATPRSFRLIESNQLGEEAYASPVICGSRVYLRTGEKEERNRQYLYSIGK
ncbi:MAG: serine/threonine protein kinase [Verrucomicrobia bacterium]|nr:serine/threonine protein kinase [Verrucomicrobiota bacterium]